MMGDWGITQPIMTRARFTDESKTEIKHDAIDGYHRIAGLEMVHPEGKNALIKSIVLYGCSDAEMYKQRIIAANSVESIKFARVVLWINKAWSITPWSHLISATQAFGMAWGNTSGNLLIKDEVVADQIKAWVRERAKEWMSQVGTIYMNLRTYDLADPKLVLKVRTGTFAAGELALTPKQLGVIVNKLPHEKFPDLQMPIAEFATSHSLNTTRIGELVGDIGRLRSKDLENVQKKVFSLDKWKRKTRILKGKEKRNLSNSTQAIPRLDAAKRVILFSSDIDNERKTRLIQQIDEIILEINSNTHEDANLNAAEEAKTFLDKWERSNLLLRVNRDNYIRDEFLKDIGDLNQEAALMSYQYFTEMLFSRVMNQRDIASEVLSAVPIQNLQPKSALSIVEILSKRVRQLAERTIPQEETSVILENLIGVLDAIISLQELVPEAWRNLMHDLQETSIHTDSLCRKAIILWTESKLGQSQESDHYRNVYARKFIESSF